jgi:purine nucleosidase
MELIIDCDPGVDDAIALLLAFAAPELRIRGITTVAGNVSLTHTSANARRICELANQRNIPIFAGCPRPILRSLETAAEVHGETGLKGIELPAPTLPIADEHAVSWLIQTLLANPEPITIAALGPLTNIAVAIIQAPQIIPKIREIVLMGGAITHGNVTPSAEFNFYADPHAAHIVFTAGAPLTMISLDVTHTAIATPDRITAIRAIGEPFGPIVANLLAAYGVYDQERYGFAGAALHDPCVIAYLIAPELFQSQSRYVEIETTSPNAIGRSIVDWWQMSEHPANVNVITSINADGFYQLLRDRLGQLNQSLAA